MLELLSLFFHQPSTSFILAQNNPSEIIKEEKNTIRPLTGELNQIPVFNSNSPELVVGEGILLSTFPSEIDTPYLTYRLKVGILALQILS